MQLFEKYASNIIDENMNMCMPFYLMGAYAYYEESNPIFSDAYFDGLCKKMLKGWKEWDHHHKYLIEKDDLEAGTYLGDYPGIVKGSLSHLRHEMYISSKKRKKKNAN